MSWKLHFLFGVLVTGVPLLVPKLHLGTPVSWKLYFLFGVLVTGVLHR